MREAIVCEDRIFIMPRAAISAMDKGGTKFSASRRVTGTYRLAVPRRGHVLSTVVEAYAAPVRDAVNGLSQALPKKACITVQDVLFAARANKVSSGLARPDSEMTSWAIVSMWAVGIATKEIPRTASLPEAVKWFLRSESKCSLTDMVPDEAWNEAEALLHSSVDPAAYLELLPYILDPHGPGSRLSVRRDPSTRVVQKRKRAEGVFYTPADVAEYMARVCIGDLPSNVAATVFDPACGTGVFLRAALQELVRLYPDRGVFSLAKECLFGTDIDPWPLDAAAFVLLADCWSDIAAHETAPAQIWRRLRQNLACIDTLLIDCAEAPAEKNAGASASGKDRIQISRLFPALEHGPTVILGNPPYANLGQRADLADLGRIFRTLAVNPCFNAEISIAFIEQMIRLASPETSSGALVLPLSLACNVGAQFSTARELISTTRGRWRFAFFDREPHALFGEDVKTRNAIVHWSRTPGDKGVVLETGPLRKWRGDIRAAMFESLRFTVVDTDIRAGIPKVEGPVQSAGLKALAARWNHLEQAVCSIERFNLADVPKADDRTVFVGATAYNFINVFLKPDCEVFRGDAALSEHPLHAINCASRADALAVFAVLSSHVAYWWWHANGDGFHVSRRFLAELPFGLDAVTPPVRDVLSECGRTLWSLIEHKPIVSVNRGRTSIAYTPNGHDEIRRRIDETLADLIGLEGEFVGEIQQFTANTVAATLRARTVTATEEKETS